MIRKVGLTGGIASGKTYVSGLLSRLLGCELIDTDVICSHLLEPQAKGWQQFTSEFGSKYLTGEDTIDRPKLRHDLFNDEKFREKVNSIIHPLVKKNMLARMVEIIDSDSGSRVLVEVPLLYEVQWEDLFDTVIVVYADHEKCLNRLMDRDGKSEDEAVKELQSQWPLHDKVIKADHVIDNSGSMADTNSQVEHLAEMLKK
jgi:dephospho-CoA kinase